MEHRTLTIWFPLPATVKCPYADCSARFLVKVWTSVKQSVVRHTHDMHDVADSTIVKCTGCEIMLGVRPGAHKCRYAIEEAEGAAERFACTIDGCSDSFPSKQGLTNHVRSHKRRDAFANAVIPLPAPATRQ